MLSIRKTLLTVLLPVLLQACAVQQQKINSLADQLELSTPEATLLSLQSISPPERDRAQYLLNTGLLKSITGDFEGANSDLQSAKNILNDLQAVSVTENLGAAMVNETLRSYDGSASERVLLHLLLSINYLMLNNLDAARVEVLQADIVMKELAREDRPIGQLASAHYIAGLVYELGSELDDAMISYRKAANIMALRNMPPPPALKSSLLSLSKRLGLDEEYEKYREQFTFAANPPTAGRCRNCRDLLGRCSHRQTGQFSQCVGACPESGGVHGLTLLPAVKLRGKPFHSEHGRATPSYRAY